MGYIPVRISKLPSIDYNSLQKGSPAKIKALESLEIIHTCPSNKPQEEEFRIRLKFFISTSTAQTRGQNRSKKEKKD